MVCESLALPALVDSDVLYFIYSVPLFCHWQKGKTKPVHVVDVPGHSRLQTKLDDFLPQAAGVVFVVDAVEFLPKSRAVSEYVQDVVFV